MEMEQNHTKQKQGNYLKFFLMIGTSMLVMFFLMYLNSYQILDHAWFSETRLFMTMIMGAAMMVVMLVFMLGMYKNNKVNIAIFIGAGLLLLLSIWLVLQRDFGFIVVRRATLTMRKISSMMASLIIIDNLNRFMSIQLRLL